MRDQIQKPRWREGVLLLAAMAFAAAPAAAQAPQRDAAANGRTRQAARAAAPRRVLAASSLDLDTIKGSGTVNFIPIWTSGSTIHSSVLSQSGGNLSTTGGISAATFAGSGAGLTGVNAAKLGGMSPSSFATLGDNTFTGNQTINGNLTLSGSINNALTLQGNVSNPVGQGANVIGGFGGSGGFPGNSVASGVIGATIAGGGGVRVGLSEPNTVTFNWGTVAGGFGNTASKEAATVAGGAQNTASGIAATVAGGGSNTASGEGATVAGGEGNTASGGDAIVAGGGSNTASGDLSFAAGNNANANHAGSFVWGDASTFRSVSDTAANQFVARASGGFTFYTESHLSTGATLAAGSGSWASLSDRNVKANLSAVDGQGLLTKIAALPISTWNYKAQPSSVRHLGPMAQDFRAAFGLGEDDKHISTVDAEGVALAAIQALYQLSREKDRKIEELSQEVKELQAQVARLARQP